MPSVPEISVTEFHDRRTSGDAGVLIDVREPYERDIATLGGTLIPLRQLPMRLGELRPHQDEPVVVYCRSGARSAQAVAFLRSQGFSEAYNLKGGILAWHHEVDSDVPTY